MPCRQQGHSRPEGDASDGAGRQRTGRLRPGGVAATAWLICAGRAFTPPMRAAREEGTRGERHQCVEQPRGGDTPGLRACQRLLVPPNVLQPGALKVVQRLRLGHHHRPGGPRGLVGRSLAAGRCGRHTQAPRVSCSPTRGTPSPPPGLAAATQVHTHPAASSGLGARAVRRRKAPRWLRTGARPASSRPTCWNLTRLRHLSFSCTPVRPLQVGVAGRRSRQASEGAHSRIADTRRAGEHPEQRAGRPRPGRPATGGRSRRAGEPLVRRWEQPASLARARHAAVPGKPQCCPSLCPAPPGGRVGTRT